MELVHGHALHEIVGRVDHHAEAVDGDGELDIVDASLGAQLHLRLLDGAGRVGDVGLAAAELLEPPAGAGHTHGDADVAIRGVAELLSHCLRYREDGAGAVDVDVPLQGGEVGHRGLGRRLSEAHSHLEHFLDGAVEAVVAAESQHGVAGQELLLGQRVDLIGERDVPGLADEGAVGRVQVVLNECLDVGLVDCSRRDVDEQRPRQGRIGAVVDGLVVGQNAAVTAVDGHQLQPIGVLGVVGIPEVAQCSLVVGDAGDQDVVVLAGQEVGARCLRFSVHRLGEVVEGAGVHAGGIQAHVPVGPLRANLVPLRDDLLGLRGPDGVELVHGHALDEIVAWVYHHAEAVDGNG